MMNMLFFMMFAASIMLVKGRSEDDELENDTYELNLNVDVSKAEVESQSEISHFQIKMDTFGNNGPMEIEMEFEDKADYGVDSKTRVIFHQLQAYEDSNSNGIMDDSEKVGEPIMLEGPSIWTVGRISTPDVETITFSSANVDIVCHIVASMTAEYSPNAVKFDVKLHDLNGANQYALLAEYRADGECDDAEENEDGDDEISVSAPAGTPAAFFSWTNTVDIDNGTPGTIGVRTLTPAELEALGTTDGYEGENAQGFWFCVNGKTQQTTVDWDPEIGVATKNAGFALAPSFALFLIVSTLSVFIL